MLSIIINKTNTSGYKLIVPHKNVYMVSLPPSHYRCSLNTLFPFLYTTSLYRSRRVPTYSYTFIVAENVDLACQYQNFFLAFGVSLSVVCSQSSVMNNVFHLFTVMCKYLILPYITFIRRILSHKTFHLTLFTFCFRNHY